MSTFLDLIRGGGQAVEKSSGQYTPPDAARDLKNLDKLPMHPLAGVVLRGIEQKLLRQQRPTKQGEKVLKRQPTFLDVVLGRSAGLEVRQADHYDAALETTEADNEAALAAFLEALEDEEPTKSYADEVQSGDYVSKSGLNVSRIARDAVAKAMEKAGL